MNHNQSNNQVQVIVVGAGAAGLAAAMALTRANIDCLILESKSRTGGRACTINTSDGHHVELGAEFIHGKNQGIWDLIKSAQLPTMCSDDSRIHVKKNNWQEGSSQWDPLEQLFFAMSQLTDPDRSVAEAVSAFKEQGFDNDLIDFFVDYIQGYNAANINDMSIQALINAEQEANDMCGFKHNSRLRYGYGHLMQWLVDQIGAHRIRLNAVVEKVKWSNSNVEVTARDSSGIQTFRANKLILTLPLGVWMAKPGELGHVAFDPHLEHRATHLSKLQMGHALHIAFEFDQNFLRETVFNSKLFDEKIDHFVRVPKEKIAVWWTFRSAQKIFWVGWLAGPSAEQMVKLSDAAIIDEALACFSNIFELEKDLLKLHLKHCYFHNWSQDPFSRGAYAYVKVDGLGAQYELKKSIDNTLYFAGEMIPPRGFTGLVDGAMASGFAAAKEIIKLTIKPYI